MTRRIIRWKRFSLHDNQDRPELSRPIGEFAPEDFAFHRQASPLVVFKEDSPLPELLSEDPILSYEVLNSVLLFQEKRGSVPDFWSPSAPRSM